jgi:hypothetical protein
MSTKITIADLFPHDEGMILVAEKLPTERRATSPRSPTVPPVDVSASDVADG